MNYQPVSAGNRTNGYGGSETISDARQAGKERVPAQEYILLPLLHTSSYVPSSSKEAEPNDDAGKKATEQPTCDKEGKTDDLGGLDQQVKSGDNAENINSTNSINTASRTINTTDALEDTGIFDDAYDDRDEGVEADYNNLETVISVSHIPSIRTNKDHAKEQIIREVHSVVQTRRMIKQSEAGLVTFINKQRRTNYKDFQNCLFACFLSQMEPKKVTQALDDESWVEAMQEKLLQFKLLNVWTLMDLPRGKRAIGTKWVFRNKKDQRGIVVRNKARMVGQGHRQEEGIDYDEVFAPVAKIEAIRLFFVYVSFMDFIVYQMDVKSAFLYESPDRVYKVERALYGLHQAPRAWYETLSTCLLENRFRRGTIDKNLFIKKIKNATLFVQVYVDDIIFGSTKKSLSTEFDQLMHKRFQMSSMGELTFFLGLQVEQRHGIFLSHEKYVYDILKKFGFSSVKTTTTPMEIHQPLSKDADETDVDVHLYRFQVQPKASHMYAVKRIFIYLKGQPTLGVWYPKDSPLDLIAFSDSDYASASLDRKSTTGGTEDYTQMRFELVLKGKYDAKLLNTAGLYKKELAIPGQMTTGKESSNPLIADSLLKTILPAKLVR
ncbi:putative ribonuclease H-like domain-containing protein [Tanacetum coccineum]